MTTLALNMMVRNAASVIKRALLPLLPYVDEVVIVDTGSTDGTRELTVTLIDQCPRTSPHLRFELITVNEETHPHLYLYDEASTFRDRSSPPRSSPTQNTKHIHHDVPGPFTGKSFLARWDLTRQMALDATRSDFMIFVDADDVWKGDQAMAGSRLSTLLALMEKKDLDVLYLPYEYRHDREGNSSYHQLRERLCRTGSARWKGHTHEVLVPSRPDHVLALDEPIVMDMHDNSSSSQVSHRAFKVLWKEWQETTDKASSDPHLLFQLGHEARAILPDLALDLLEQAITADGTALVYKATGSVECGFIHETERNDLDGAERQYLRAQGCYPDLPEAALGLGRVALKRSHYAEAMSHLGKALTLAEHRNASLIHHDPKDRFGRCRAYLALAQANAGLHAKAMETAWAARDHLDASEMSSLLTILARKKSPASSSDLSSPLSRKDQTIP